MLRGLGTAALSESNSVNVAVTWDDSGCVAMMAIRMNASATFTLLVSFLDMGVASFVGVRK